MLSALCSPTACLWEILLGWPLGGVASPNLWSGHFHRVAPPPAAGISADRWFAGVAQRRKETHSVILCLWKKWGGSEPRSIFQLLLGSSSQVFRWKQEQEESHLTQRKQHCHLYFQAVSLLEFSNISPLFFSTLPLVPLINDTITHAWVDFNILLLESQRARSAQSVFTFLWLHDWLFLLSISPVVHSDH